MNKNKSGRSLQALNVQSLFTSIECAGLSVANVSVSLSLVFYFTAILTDLACQ